MPLEQIHRLRPKGFVIPLRQGTQAGDDGSHVSGKNVVQQRQDLMAQPVAPGAVLMVRPILPIPQAVLLHVVVDVCPTPLQQRAMQLELGRPHLHQRQGLHAGDSVEPSTTAEMSQNGLGLIIRMVGQVNLTCTMLERHVSKKLMTQVPPSRLDGNLMLPGMAGGIHLPDLHRQIQPPSQKPHKGSILTGVPPPQPMIEVANNQVGNSLSMQPVQQRHRIPPAGDGDEAGGRLGWH